MFYYIGGITTSRWRGSSPLVMFLALASLTNFTLANELPAARSLFLARPGTKLYWVPANCCGLSAAYVVSHQLDRPIALERLAGQIPFGASGTSMKALHHYFEKCGLDASGVKMTCDELHDCLQANRAMRAIALVRPNHWVAV